MNRTILVYFNGTFVNRENGAQARVNDLLKFLITTGRRIVLYSYYEHPSCPWGQDEIERFHVMYPEIDLVLDHRGSLIRFVTALKLRLIALMPQAGARLLPFRLKALTPAYEQFRKDQPDATTIVNYAHGLAELNGVDLKEVFVETHDINFVNGAKSLHRSLTAVKTTLSARMELELLGAAVGLIAIAPPEAALFRLFYPDMPVYFIPAYQLGLASDIEEEVLYEILFVGSENALNVDGLCRFISANRTWLSGRTMAVVGRVCAVDRVREAVAELPTVDLLGYVDDLSALMQHCCFLVSPVDGTGLKIKALEAFTAGLPVFGSRITLDGLPQGYNECAFPIDQAAMERLITDRSLRRRAQEAARLYAKKIIANDDLERLRSILSQ